jgi:hypothetical protein
MLAQETGHQGIHLTHEQRVAAGKEDEVADAPRIVLVHRPEEPQAESIVTIEHEGPLA